MYIFTNSSNLDKVLQSRLFFPKSLLNLHVFFFRSQHYNAECGSINVNTV